MMLRGLLDNCIVKIGVNFIVPGAYHGKSISTGLPISPVLFNVYIKACQRNHQGIAKRELKSASRVSMTYYMQITQHLWHHHVNNSPGTAEKCEEHSVGSNFRYTTNNSSL